MWGLLQRLHLLERVLLVVASGETVAERGKVVVDPTALLDGWTSVELRRQESETEELVSRRHRPTEMKGR